MTFRIAIGGIAHETNTYADASAGTTPIDQFQISVSGTVLERYHATRTYVGGMLDEAEALGAAAIPTLVSVAQPSGTIERAAYESMRDDLVARIAEAMPLDAVALDLHGAGVAEGYDDLEGDLVAAVRAAAGPDVKIVASFDLHGNITQRMADHLDGMFGVHYYPHTDMYERGREAVALVPRLLAGEVRPVHHIERVPMLLPTSTTNFGAAARMNEKCWEVEKRPGVIDCTFFHGFPYTDIPGVGCFISVTADGDAALATTCAKEVAQFLWDMREEFRPDVLNPDEAIAVALRTDGRPIVVNETSDNAGGGTPADGTWLLKAMLDAKLDDACFGFICDREVAAAAHDAGVGETIDVRLGGKTDDLHGPPLHVRAYVKSLSDGRFKLKALATGLAMDLGRMARLRIDGLDVIVGSVRSQTFDPELFLLNGIDVTRYKIVALKSSNHFRAGFDPIAAAIVTADAPGLTTLRTEVFERHRAMSPMWPKDPEAMYGNA